MAAIEELNQSNSTVPGHLVLLWAFALPLSIAVAEPFAFLSIAAWLYIATVRRRGFPGLRRCGLLLPLMLYIVIAVLASSWGVRPSVSFSKMHRLVLLLLVFAVGEAIRSWQANGARQVLARPVYFFVSGAALLALYDLVRVPVECMQGTALFDTGNMRDPQMFMVALIFLVARLVVPGAVRAGNIWLWGLFLSTVGLIVHFKRGVWIACAASLVMMSVLVRKWRLIAALLLSVGAVLLVPAVRERLAQIPEAFSGTQGGRYVLWTDVAPELLREHPFGMGLCATQNDDFLEYTRYVQPKLNHLHNNALQIAVELGWAGLAAWILWILAALWLMVSNLLKALKACDPLSWIAVGTLCAFVGLLLNGMVEYNFGDSEILMLFLFLIGVAWAQQLVRDEAV